MSSTWGLKMKKMLIGVLVASALAVATHAAEPDADRAVRSKLGTRLQKVDFDNIELADVIQFIRDISGINIYVKWNSLANVGVEKATSVTLHLKDVTIEKVLRILLADLGQTKPLDYAIVEGILIISSSENPGGGRAAPASKQPAEAQWTDVLKLVDLKKHVIHGRWIRKDGYLHNLDTMKLVNDPVSRVLVPVAPSGSYEVDVVFIRKSGTQPIAVILPVGQTGTCLNLSYGPRRRYGLTKVNGRIDNESTRSLLKLSNGEEHRIHVRVLIKGGDAEIVADLDGKELVRWKGKQSLLTVSESRLLPDGSKIGLSARSPAIFKSVRFRQIRGETAPSPLVPRAGVKPAEQSGGPADIASVQAESGTYFRIPIKGGIGSDFSASRMKSLLRQAVEQEASVIVLEVDSGGGSTLDAEKIVNMIIESKGLRFVALVRKAISAAAVITLSCSDIFVTETATIGAAVSYATDSRGRQVIYSSEVAEKMQSIWRATCRKAAEHGGHPSVLAEAMADPNFALTLRNVAGKTVLERDGRGDVFKARGRVLAMTAREAVKCGLAKEVVPADIASLGTKLGFTEWQVAKPSSPLGQDGIASNTGLLPDQLRRILSEKIEALRITDESLTRIQKSEALKEWNAWCKRNDFIGRRVLWSVVLKQASETESQMKLDGLYRSLKDYEKRLAASRERSRESRSYQESHLDEAKMLGGKIASIKGRISELRSYPFRVRASAPDGSTLVAASVSKYAKRYLADAAMHENIRLSGEIQHFEVDLDSGELTVQLVKCEVGDRAILPKQRLPQKTGEATPEEKAKKLFDMAIMYETNGVTRKAIELLGTIVQSYPDTPAAKEAQAELQRLVDKSKNTNTEKPDDS